MSVRTRFLRKRWSIFGSVEWWSVKSGFIRSSINRVRPIHFVQYWFDLWRLLWQTDYIFTLPHGTVSLLSILMWSLKVPATQKLILGDWIAQWDTTYGAWFFYNINTGRVSGSLLHLSANCGRYFAKSGDTGLVFANTISHHTSCWAWDFSPGELGHQSICFVTYENTQDVTKFSKILSLFKVADSC